MGTFKAGDRVQFVRGGKGTIIGERKGGYDEAWYVRWDEKGPKTSGTDWAYTSNLTLLFIPTKEEIESALATLRNAGKVDFVPDKVPFAPVHVRINSDYVAIVSETDVRVGCQRIQFSAIKELALAVKSAQEYNRGK